MGAKMIPTGWLITSGERFIEAWRDVEGEIAAFGSVSSGSPSVNRMRRVAKEAARTHIPESVQEYNWQRHAGREGWSCGKKRRDV